MAERKITAGTYFLFIDPENGTNYSTMICLKSFTFTRGTAIIDSATFCGPDTQAGAQTVGVTFTGQIMLNPDADRISEPDLHNLWAAKTTIAWKIAHADPSDGDVSYEGHGFIAQLDDTFDLSNSDFSGSIGLAGIPTQTIEAES